MTAKFNTFLDAFYKAVIPVSLFMLSYILNNLTTDVREVRNEVRSMHQNFAVSLEQCRTEIALLKVRISYLEGGK